MKLKDFIRTKWQILSVILLAITFFFATSAYNFHTQTYSPDGDFVKWASPDGTANYIFTKFYAQEGELVIEENYNKLTGDIMHPRSLRSDNGLLKPVSFLGIILIYGKIASLTSYKVIPYLTPFFASLSIIFFYLLISKIFNKKNALLSTLFLACFPPFVFYTARSMFHNVLLVSFLIIGLYFCTLIVKNKSATCRREKTKLTERIKFFFTPKPTKIDWTSLLSACLAGLFIGAAVISRTSELIWLAPVLFIIWMFNFRKIGLSRLLLFFAFVFLTLIPVAFHNQILYGSPTSGGYSEMNTTIASLSKASTEAIKVTAAGKFDESKELLNKIKSGIFYFGIHPRFSLKMFYQYFIKMFYWLFWPSLFGFFMYALNFKEYKKRIWVYLLALGVCSAILTIYYGSWVFHDNPDPNSFTIGNSYTRYWLPFYLGAIPFASLLLMKSLDAIKLLLNKLSNSIKSKPLRKALNKNLWTGAILILIISSTYFISIKFVLVGSVEGLIPMAERQIQARTEWEEIISLTESNSTIITRYHDKLLFPERKVIVGLFNDQEMNKKYSKLAEYLPVYYYNFTLRDIDLDYLNNKRLAEVNLSITPIKSVTKDFTLYKLSTAKPLTE